jgi:hypothetical protein
MNSKHILCNPFYFKSKSLPALQARLYARQLVSFIPYVLYINMLHWLKSGKLSSGTYCDKVVGHEGGEGPRESEDLQGTETERIEKENERKSDDAPEETEE